MQRNYSQLQDKRDPLKGKLTLLPLIVSHLDSFYFNISLMSFDRPRYVSNLANIFKIFIESTVVLNAWEERYEGSNHVLLYDNINEMKRRAAYSTTVAIVQSSGTGKSRMVDEQANLVFTLPFCLRPPKDAKSMY